MIHFVHWSFVSVCYFVMCELLLVAYRFTLFKMRRKFSISAKTNSIISHQEKKVAFPINYWIFRKVWVYMQKGLQHTEKNTMRWVKVGQCCASKTKERGNRERVWFSVYTGVMQVPCQHIFFLLSLFWNTYVLSLCIFL